MDRDKFALVAARKHRELKSRDRGDRPPEGGRSCVNESVVPDLLPSALPHQDHDRRSSPRVYRQ